MSKNTKRQNWMQLPVEWSEIYPKRILDLANKLGIDPKEIAEKEKIEPIVVSQDWIRRDIVEMIYKVSADPENPNKSIIFFITGDFDIVNVPAQEMISQIEKFIDGEYIYHYRDVKLQIKDEQQANYQDAGSDQDED